LSQAAIDAYRAHHLGQVGQPSRKKRRLKQKMEAAAAPTAAAPTAPPQISGQAQDGGQL